MTNSCNNYHQQWLLPGFPKTPLFQQQKHYDTLGFMLSTYAEWMDGGLSLTSLWHSMRPTRQTRTTITLVYMQLS